MEEYLEYRKAWENIPKEHRVSRVPLHLDVELTNKCQLQCDFCPYHSEKALYRPEALEDMDFQLYRKIIDEISVKGTKAIKLNYRGEPLLYKWLPEAVQYAKAKGIVDVMLNTNGLLLDSNMSTRLIYSGLNTLILSDYNDIKQYKNLEQLYNLRKELGFENPLIIVQSNTDRHWQNVADIVRPSIFYDYNTPNENIDKSPFECKQPWLRFVVLADGTVLSCSCGIVVVDKILGNVKQFTIEELWNSIRMKFIRTCHEGHRSDLIRQCRMCPARNSYRNEKELKEVMK